MPILSIADVELHGKRVLVREDFNVPINDGKIMNDARIRAALPTLRYLLGMGASVMVASHLGRPDQPSEALSLAPVASHLGHLLETPTRLITHWADESYRGSMPGYLDVWENTRFNAGEYENDTSLAKQMAACCDVFVMDAFGTAHREHASTCGVTQFATTACAGPLLLNELKALEHFAGSSSHPLVAVIGGAKISTKLGVLRHLLETESSLELIDTLILGGGILNTCLAARGVKIGASLYEPTLLHEARQLLSFAETQNVAVPMPDDVVVIPADVTFDSAEVKTKTRVCAIEAIDDNDKIVDIGPRAAENLTAFIHDARAILWNGPVGVFEIPAFAQGTTVLAQAIAASDAYSVAGGGDTLAVIDQLKLADKLSYISTGGGAFLSLLEGKPLPALRALEESASRAAITTD